MDTRREHGQYWPGNRTDAGGETPAGTDNGKVDRVDLGTLPADATASEMRTAIRNIQNAMRPLATTIAAALCGFVMAQTAPWDGLRGGVHVVTNEQDAVAMAEIARATNGIPAQIVAATNDIPAQIAAATNGIPTEIAAATNGLPERIAAVTNGLSAYALKTQIPDMPDLSPYALKSEVPPAPDLTGYATKYEVALATNEIPARIVATTNGLPEKIAAATNGIPAEIAAATNGLPEKIVVATNGLPEKISTATNALHTSLAHTISVASTALQPAATNAVAEEMAGMAANLSKRIDQISLAFASSNTATRLATHEGSIYQDATGVVWRAENFDTPGLFSLKKIEYHTNGVYQAETKAPAGINWTLWEEYKETWGIVAGESERAEDPEERYREWLDFTNHVAAADMEDPEGTNFSYTVQLDVAGEIIDLTTNEWIKATTVLIEWPMSNTNVERYLVFERTNVTATIRTPIDRVMYASSEGGSKDVQLAPVYSQTPTYGWDCSLAQMPEGTQITTMPYFLSSTWNMEATIPNSGYDGAWELLADGDESATNLTFRNGSYVIPATRIRTDIIGYTLGTQTNKVLTSTNALISASITNGLASASSVAAASAAVAQAATNYTDSALSTTSFTNSVCGIITNEVDSWEYTGMPEGAVVEEGYPKYEVGFGWQLMFEYDGKTYYGATQEYPESATEISLTCVRQGGSSGYGITMKHISVNELGLARLIDLSPLTNGLASAGSVAAASAAVAQSATNYTDSAIAATDTSYPRVTGITNVNQTVQYVSISSAVPTNLVIQLPTTGDTKDWIVYVTSQTNVTINLPAATWWLADNSATNDIAPQTPTALYFSQAADTIYTIGRQEFTEVVQP